VSHEPGYNRGESKQDYETPRELLDPVEARFGTLEVDLACTAANAKAPIALAWPVVDSLTVPWAEHFGDRIMWLNPPFADIEPWALKCKLEGAKLRGPGRIILLTPAAIGSNWFAQHVHGNALVLGLSPRITYVGSSQPYPKDCMLSIFGAPIGFEPWRYGSPAKVRKPRKSSASARTEHIDARIAKLEAEREAVR
jgi:hypothetical protein